MSFATPPPAAARTPPGVTRGARGREAKHGLQEARGVRGLKDAPNPRRQPLSSRIASSPRHRTSLAHVPCVDTPGYAKEGTAATKYKVEWSSLPRSLAPSPPEPAHRDFAGKCRQNAGRPAPGGGGGRRGDPSTLGPFFDSGDAVGHRGGGAGPGVMT